MPPLLTTCFAALLLFAAPGVAAGSGALAGPSAITAQGRAKPAVRRLAQAPSDITAAGHLSNGAAARLKAAQARAASLVRQMGALRATYNKQLSAIDKLKKSRASWRRDRKLREQKARSQKTALALQSLDSKLRSQRILVTRERKATVRAVEAELVFSPSAGRRQYLGKVLANARRGLKASPKKISIPDLEFDVFADPEELLEQIALIDRAEAKLAREETSLERRESHYTHMAALRSKRDRAEELTAFESDNVRRSTGRTGQSGGQADRSAEPPDANEGPDDGGGSSGLSGDVGTSFEASSVVLSDVVDSGTLDALRRAHRSSSPRTKAEAAHRAHLQVQARLKRLRESKAQIKAHLRRHAK